MLELIKKDSTRKLVGALTSLEIIEPYNCIEYDSYVDVQFKVAKENKEVWFTVINRLAVLNPKLLLSKRFIQINGQLVFTWSIAIASETLDEDINIISSQLNSQFNINPNKPVVVNTKKQIRKPFVSKANSNEGEIPILNASPKRNVPKPGSTKGVYVRDERGSGEASLMRNFYQSKLRGASE